MRRADYEQTLEATRRWIAEHGRYPQQNEWEGAWPPTTRTIKRRWGWEELMTAATGDGADIPQAGGSEGVPIGAGVHAATSS